MKFYFTGNSLTRLKGPSPKVLLTMKLTVLLLLAVCIQVSAKVEAQTITYSKKNVSIEKVLNEVTRQTGYQILYNSYLVGRVGKISLHLDRTPLHQALEIMFKNQPLTYSIIGNIIVIREREQDGQQDSASESLQLTEIHGSVVDSLTGKPLVGVTIRVKGSTIGTTTDVNGQFTLNVPSNSVLEVSYLGYTSQLISLKGRVSLHIRLVTTATGLNQLVVIGYGTQKEKDVTGAITSIQSKDFVKGFASDAAQLIRGKVPGLAVSVPDANPTTVSQVNLRGIATLVGNNAPLVLIDGIPGSLIDVAPEDVASISVLKDGSAAAIYGTRGSNGVILITTKKSNYNSRPVVSLRMYYTTQRMTRKLDFMNANQYRKLVTEGVPGAIDGGANTDWLSLVTQKPLSQVYNINIRGGGQNTNYDVNLNYRNLNGIMKRSNNVLLYPSVRVTHKMFGNKLKIGGFLSGYQQHYYTGENGGSYDSSVYKGALIYNPTDPVRDSDGNYTEHMELTEYPNPVALLMESNGLTQITELKTASNISYKPIDALNFNLLSSIDISNYLMGFSSTNQQYYNLRLGRDGYASRASNRKEEDLFEVTGTYDKQFGSHSISVLAGYSWINDKFQSFSMQNYNFPTNQLSYNNMGAGQALSQGEASESSNQTASKLVGYFARIDYSFKDKYLIQASLRREGSSKFGINHKYGNFPAISAGWNIAQEPFFKKNIPFINILKLRGGIGITGTEPASPYESLSILNFNQYAYMNGAWTQTPNSSQNPNPNLQWERSREVDIGIDFGVLDKRINGSIDFYNRLTQDLLFNYPVATPPYLYGQILANAATMRNKGIEISLNAIPIETKDFSWNTSVNYSNNANRLLSLSGKGFQLASGYFNAGSTGEPIQQPTNRVQIGQPIGNFYGYKSIGIDSSGHWIIEGANGKPKPIADETEDDKQIIGNGVPKTYLSWNNSFRYKNFDLNILMRGAFGFQILNLTRLFYSSFNLLSRANVLVSTTDKVYGKRELNYDQELQYVSYYVEDGNYWKIDNITLGYSFNINSKYLKAIRVYSSASNLMTFTKYSGIDPELNILGMSPGIDDNFRYPSTSSYTLGALITFQ